MLRNKWLAVALFILVLFLYELFDLWSSPWWTAWLIIAYFIAVLAVDGIFKHASFCKFVCPLGQFNFMASLLSPLEVKVRDQQVCGDCHTKDCIRGQRLPGPDLVVVQRGCESAFFQPLKAGNMDCTFCLDCVHACPHDNVGIISRMPASELMTDPARSGIGLFSRRKDLSALAIVFTFGALLNAFGMVSPVYVVERWLAARMQVSYEAPVLGVIFGFFLLLEPLVLLGLAAAITRGLGVSSHSPVKIALRYSYALVPLGFGMWLAHYGFHLFTGLLTIIPITQSAVASLGTASLGDPRWMLTGIPVRFVQPIELGFITLGIGRIAAGDASTGGRRLRRAPDESVYSLGGCVSTDRRGGGVADVSAYGNACYFHDELMMGSKEHRTGLKWDWHGRIGSAAATFLVALILAIPARGVLGSSFSYHRA